MIYDVPFFKRGNWFMKNVVGNWEVAPVVTYQTGTWATVQSVVDANLNGDSAGDRAVINPAGTVNVGLGRYGTEELRRRRGGLSGEQSECTLHPGPDRDAAQRRPQYRASEPDRQYRPQLTEARESHGAFQAGTGRPVRECPESCRNISAIA